MLTALDWVIIGVVAISAVMSIFRGFIKEASSILSWIVAFIVSSKFYPMASTYVTFSNDELTRNVISCIVLFVVTLVVLGFISNAVSSLVKKAGLSSFDRILGVAFGVARGILIVTAVLALAKFLFALHIITFIQDYPWYKNSQFVPDLLPIVNWFFTYVGTAETGA